MRELWEMMGTEARKAFRSSMPFWTTLGALFMPFGITFLLFVAKNPQISQRLGLIGAKANLMAYAAADWATYMELFGQLIAAGGFIFFVFIVSWVFGREFADGTVKDLLAVPTARASILLAKFSVAAVWSAIVAWLIFLVGALLGAMLRLPGDASAALLHGGARLAVVAGLTIAVVTPFALFASIGRGYLLPIGAAVLLLMTANLAAVIGRGEYFPWAVPGLYAQGKDLLPAVSYWIVLLTALAGVLATILWWQYADQNR